MIRTLTAVAALSIAALAGPALAQPDGKQLYELQCKFCHDDDTLGPPLAGVHERKIGSTSFEYSDSMKAKGADQTWNDANLEAFLKAPNDFTPGTKMQMSVTDDANRAAIITYLKTLKPE